MALIDDDVVEAANRRAAARKAQYPAVVAARYDRRIGRIVLSLDSGLEISFSPRQAEGFEHARPADLDVAVISPSGFGVHFPKIDADIYVPALIDGFLGSQRWLAAQNGRVGGKASTPAKQSAARANGKPGGRPKKVPVAAEPKADAPATVPAVGDTGDRS